MPSFPTRSWPRGAGARQLDGRPAPAAPGRGATGGTGAGMSRCRPKRKGLAPQPPRPGPGAGRPGKRAVPGPSGKAVRAPAQREQGAHQQGQSAGVEEGVVQPAAQQGEGPGGVPGGGQGGRAMGDLPLLGIPVGAGARSGGIPGKPGRPVQGSRAWALRSCEGSCSGRSGRGRCRAVGVRRCLDPRSRIRPGELRRGGGGDRGGSRGEEAAREQQGQYGGKKREGRFSFEHGYPPIAAVFRALRGCPASIVPFFVS
ncbi:hypothetical protein SAMN05661077_0873 [Thiohalorhabdus denitrificans]|uniref:Uncharacterized protein n=1 Tax=Thiohalorhabdus denitrificans TaxID=381306 RepID=A0A1G5C2W5_9GAMM|nr:hypothetical protein SAMN05661077_0873 [Thiohalorhabdus denitrificans]